MTPTKKGVSLPMSRRSYGEGGSGGIKIATDERDEPCFVCGAPENIRFLLFAGPKQGNVFFLRLCEGCLNHLAELHERLRHILDQQVTAYQPPRAQ